METYNGNTLMKMLHDADEGGYAVPMFDYSDIWDQMAVLEAAEELHAPVMFASLPIGVNEIGLEMLGAIGTVTMKNASVPMIHHLDHSTDTAMCCKAVDCGYPSVMIDASKLDLETNILHTREVVRYAHAHGAVVEAEIGKIKGRGYEGSFDGGDFLVKTDDAVRLVHETGVDTLAVGIGTAHGFYEGKPEINFKRLEEVNEALDLPLVLHGGTGIPEEDVRRAIRGGINKVNVGTQIRCTYMKSAQEIIGKRGYTTHTVEIMRDVKEEIKKVVKYWIRVCMADGKA